MTIKTTTEKVKHKPSSNYGKYVHKKTISTILTCECGNKYLKTRADQKKCVSCISKV